MASTSETGHAKNLANFNRMITFCTAYGADYNPTKIALALHSLTNQYTTCDTALQLVGTTKAAFDVTINGRQAVFANIKSLAARVVNALDASDVTEAIVDDAKTILRKIRGQRATAIPAPPDPGPTPEPGPTPTPISVSHQSYDMLANSFSQLINLVSAEPAYNPNETDLSVAGLNTTLASLLSQNGAIASVYTTYSNALIDRDNQFYSTVDSMLPIADDVKKYVKSVYGNTSPQYRQLSDLKFKYPKR